MVVSTLIVSLIVGFAIPLAIADFAKVLCEGELPVQSSGLNREARALPWILGLVAGPGLFVDRLAEAWREKSVSRRDLGLGVAIAVGWAGIYGYVALTLVIAAEKFLT